MQTATVGCLGNLYSRLLTETVGVRWMFILSPTLLSSRPSGRRPREPGSSKHRWCDIAWPVFTGSRVSLRSPGMTPGRTSRRRLQRLDAHLGENIADCRQRATHVLGIKPPDAADPETVRDRQLARIDHVAALFERIIERLEFERRVRRHAEGDDI